MTEFVRFAETDGTDVWVAPEAVTHVREFDNGVARIHFGPGYIDVRGTAAAVADALADPDPVGLVPRWSGDVVADVDRLAEALVDAARRHQGGDGG